MAERGKTKEVLFDGKVIGYIDATLSDEEQVNAARALMCSQGLAHEVDEEESIFRQAQSFAHTSQKLYESGLRVTPSDFYCVAPFVVNSAFSIELYLKTLALVVSGRSPKGHRLLNLYDKLPAEAKKLVTEETPKSAKDRGLPTDTDIRTVLSSLNDTFTEWRYLHERSSTGRVDIEPTIFVMQALHFACVTAKKNRS